MGCATIPSTPGDEVDCITVINAPRDASQIYRHGERVLGDDLVAATDDSPAATELASRSRAHEWSSIASFVLGGVLLVPGIGLIADGAHEDSASKAATGAVLTVAGVGGIVAGAVLRARARREAGNAVALYNEERHHCR